MIQFQCETLYSMLQIAVYHHDGSRYTAMRYRQVAIQTSVRRRNGASIVMEETRRVIPEDSIVRYSFTPGPEDQAVIVSVSRLSIQFTRKKYNLRGTLFGVSVSNYQIQVQIYFIIVSIQHSVTVMYIKKMK